MRVSAMFPFWTICAVGRQISRAGVQFLEDHSNCTNFILSSRLGYMKPCHIGLP